MYCNMGGLVGILSVSLSVPPFVMISAWENSIGH